MTSAFKKANGTCLHGINQIKNNMVEANGFLHFASVSIGYIHWNEVPI